MQVSAQNLTPAKLAAPGSPEVGQPVLAIGYALNLQGTPTVTSGVISAIDRVIPESTTSIGGAIQTELLLASDALWTDLPMNGASVVAARVLDLHKTSKEVTFR